MLNQKVAKKLVAALGLTDADIPPHAGAVRKDGSFESASSGGITSAKTLIYRVVGFAILILIVGGAGFIFAVVRQGRTEQTTLDENDPQHYGGRGTSDGSRTIPTTCICPTTCIWKSGPPRQLRASTGKLISERGLWIAHSRC